jgi:hypothetical protein
MCGVINHVLALDSDQREYPSIGQSRRRLARHMSGASRDN